MNYLGLDLSLRETGWGLVDDDGEALDYGTFGEPDTRGPKRLHLLTQKLLDIMPDGQTVVSVEGYSMGSRGNTFDIGEWGGVAKLELYGRGDCVCLLVPPSNLKQFLTSNGNAGKPMVVKAVNRLLGIENKNDNVADALGLARMSRHWYQRRAATDYEAAAFKKVKPCYPIPFRPQTPTVSVRTRTRPT